MSRIITGEELCAVITGTGEWTNSVQVWQRYKWNWPSPTVMAQKAMDYINENGLLRIQTIQYALSEFAYTHEAFDCIMRLWSALPDQDRTMGNICIVFDPIPADEVVWYFRHAYRMASTVEGGLHLGHVVRLVKRRSDLDKVKILKTLMDLAVIYRDVWTGSDEISLMFASTELKEWIVCALRKGLEKQLAITAAESQKKEVELKAAADKILKDKQDKEAKEEAERQRKITEELTNTKNKELLEEAERQRHTIEDLKKLERERLEIEEKLRAEKVRIAKEEAELELRELCSKKGRKRKATEDKSTPRKFECVICSNDSPNVFFSSCMHMCVCRKCADHLLEQARSNKDDTVKCPVCRNAGNINDKNLFTTVFI